MKTWSANGTPTVLGEQGDKLSGKSAGRPELAACLDYLRPRDASWYRAWTGSPARWPS